MPSNLLAAKAVLAALDDDLASDKHFISEMKALRAAVEEAERASPEAAIARGEYIAGISGPSHAMHCDYAHAEGMPCLSQHRRPKGGES